VTGLPVNENSVAAFINIMAANADIITAKINAVAALHISGGSNCKCYGSKHVCCGSISKYHENITHFHGSKTK